MDREIILSKTAEKQLNILLKYLHTNWSVHTRNKFLLEVEKRLNIIKQNPLSFPKSEIKDNLHKCVITSHTTLYYTFDDHNIFVLTFFNNRQYPGKLEKELE